MQPGAQRRPGALFDHVEQPGRPAGGQVDDPGGVLGVPPGVGPLPGVLIHAEGRHGVQAGRIVDQRPAVLGDRTHRGVPAHAQRAGRGRDGVGV